MSLSSLSGVPCICLSGLSNFIRLTTGVISQTICMGIQVIDGFVIYNFIQAQSSQSLDFVEFCKQQSEKELNSSLGKPGKSPHYLPVLKKTVPLKHVKN